MKTLIRNATVIGSGTSDAAAMPRDVLIVDELIADIGRDLVVDDAEVVDATGMIVMPGFVDSHRHTWQTAFRGIGSDWTFRQYGREVHGRLRRHYLPEDVYIGNLVGRIDALDSGVTTMVDWFHCPDRPENADAAVAALRDANGRSIFCYGAGLASDDDIAPEIIRMRSQLAGEAMMLGLRGTLRSPIDVTVADVALARELDLRVSVHAHHAGGLWADVSPVADLAKNGLLDDRTTVVHGNGLSDDEFAMMADAGSSVSISPVVELGMGFGLPEVRRAVAVGIRPTLSTDDVLVSPGDMFSQMRSAMGIDRGEGGDLTSRDVLEFATVSGARACGIDHRTGVIEVGKDADLIILDTSDISAFPVNDAEGTVVTSGHPGIVDSVFVRGHAVKRHGRLRGVDMDALRAQLVASRDRIVAAAIADEE